MEVEAADNRVDGGEEGINGTWRKREENVNVDSRWQVVSTQIKT